MLPTQGRNTRGGGKKKVGQELQLKEGGFKSSRDGKKGNFAGEIQVRGKKLGFLLHGGGGERDGLEQSKNTQFYEKSGARLSLYWPGEVKCVRCSQGRGRSPSNQQQKGQSNHPGNKKKNQKKSFLLCKSTNKNMGAERGNQPKGRRNKGIDWRDRGTY